MPGHGDGREETVILVEGTLDGNAARNLRAMLRAAGGRRVILDFGRAQALDALGLAVLAAELSHAAAPVVLRGLCRQHVRMLAYLGLQLDRDGVPSPASRHAAA